MPDVILYMRREDLFLERNLTKLAEKEILSFVKSCGQYVISPIWGGVDHRLLLWMSHT